MTDRMESLHGASIQHGLHSRRVYLMNMHDAVADRVIAAMFDLCRRNGYTKIFAKVPEPCGPVFTQAGFEIEAQVPTFYNHMETVLFMGHFLDPARRIVDREALDAVLDLAMSRVPAAPPACDATASSSHVASAGAMTPVLKPLPPGAHVRLCTETDIPRMTAIYRRVFASYPFPIDSPAYIEKTMHGHIDYYGIEWNGTLVAVSSAETDRPGSNVEMTDFATLPDLTGHGFAAHLLQRMQQDMAAEGIHTAYTVARAESPAMNVTFSRAGYRFGGRLKNNTQIGG
ncbi:putative beta-lysine N-acetyltransferase, partial [bacterium]|nr:putative beta-lysine N-acetyltransferase [candidate division CSSED10-310 bacterium]